MNKTIDYYNNNAKKFILNTQAVSMLEIQQNFIKRIPSGGKILDLGCGSGRDSKAFIDAGYNVVSIDGSQKMCDATCELTGKPAICSTFQEYKTDEIFDGIWACASLLHLPFDEIESVVRALSQNLTVGGCFYMSFKYGTFRGERNGRYFTDLDEGHFQTLIASVPLLKLEILKLSSDVRPGRENEKWLNCFCTKIL